MQNKTETTRWKHLVTILSFICSLILPAAPQQCSYFTNPKVLEVQNIGVSSLIVFPNDKKKYRPSQMCDWIINSKKKEYVIKVTVLDSYIEGRDLYGDCSYDYVDAFNVHNNKHSFISRFCSDSSKNGIIVSTTSQMLLRFQSNSKFEFRGFTVSYEAAEPVKPDNSDDVNLIIGMTVGAVIFALAVLALGFLVRIYCYKRFGRRNGRLHSNPAQPQTPPQLSQGTWHTPITPASSSRNSIQQRGADNQNLPLQVVLPEYSNPVRPCTPPPAYSSIDTSNVSIAPPPYESVVKENAEAEVEILL